MEWVAWIVANGTTILSILWAAEKIVKLTPTEYDDIVVDVIGGLLKKIITGQGGPVKVRKKD